MEESRAESYIRQTFQRCQTRDTLNATFPATQHDTSKVVCNDLKITSALKSRKKSFYFLEFLFFTKGVLGSQESQGKQTVRVAYLCIAGLWVVNRIAD